MKAICPIIACLFIILGCSIRPHGPMTKEQAIEIARLYVQKTYPAFNITQNAPIADYFENRASEPYWNVWFRYPSPEGAFPRREWTSLNVEVLTNGTVRSAIAYRT
jgi:hypothetical protein